jgi:hypothetical protein
MYFLASLIIFKIYGGLKNEKSNVCDFDTVGVGVGWRSALAEK